MISDLPLALRSLLESPGFTAVIVFTLALGIGQYRHFQFLPRHFTAAVAV